MPRQAADELAHDLRPLRIAEIEIVGDARAAAPPTAVILRQASATACLPPSIRIGLAIARRDVDGQRQPLRPVLHAAPRAASPPGRCTVLPRMTWSYCSQTQRFEHSSGVAISFSSASAMPTGGVDVARMDHRQRRRCAHAAGRTAAPRRQAP